MGFCHGGPVPFGLRVGQGGRQYQVSGDPNVGMIQGTSLPTFGWFRLSKCW